MTVRLRDVGRGMWGVGMLAVIGSAAAAQVPRETEQQVRNIVEQRPQQAENAARAFLYTIAPTRFAPPPDGNGMLDSLKRQDLDDYWREVAQLTVQFEIFQNVIQRDTARAAVMAGLFGTEFEARDIQRLWKRAGDAEKRALRVRLEQIMGRHFDQEQRLRELEMADITRRLGQARSETARRAERRAEHIRFAVEDVIRGAERP